MECTQHHSSNSSTSIIQQLSFLFSGLLIAQPACSLVLVPCSLLDTCQVGTCPFCITRFMCRARCKCPDTLTGCQFLSFCNIQCSERALTTLSMGKKPAPLHTHAGGGTRMNVLNTTQLSGKTTTTTTKTKITVVLILSPTKQLIYSITSYGTSLQRKRERERERERASSWSEEKFKSQET